MTEQTTLSPPPTVIPDKLYFRIGEVSRLAGVEPYVLRYWESEFLTLNPKKSSTGQRWYRRKDVETVLEIKRLLYEKRYTIAGARVLLESGPRSPEKGKPPERQTELFVSAAPARDKIRRELLEILKLLE